MINSLEIPLSLYIHIPWCEKKCPYCDFNSHDNQQHFDETAYINALLADLDQDLKNFQDCKKRTIQSIFIGGGTPSLFSAKAYKKLLSEISTRLDIENAEITIEANPSSSEQQKFIGYREAGINRLSIGTQSYNDKLLAKIGRIHNQQDALSAAQSARSAGFDNFNIDIMFALPGQSLEQSQHDINQAINLSPTHMSCYQLTLEPNTLFYKHPPKLPDSDLAWEMQNNIQQSLSAAGYEQYEVSAYAKPKHQCQHNLNYWQFGDYLAIGAGAHGKITTNDGEAHRYWKQKQPKTYLDTACTEKRIGSIEIITQDSLLFEFMLNALRLKNGFAASLLKQRTGIELNSFKTILNKHEEKGLIYFTGDSDSLLLHATDKGYTFIDSILNDYLP